MRQSTARFLLVTTAMPSLATWTSSYLIPAFSQTGASSSSLIARDASEMSVSPAQNFSKPPPVPDWPTVTWTLGCSSLKSSPAASANGKTVEEPSIRIVPVSSSFAPPAGLPPVSVVVAAASRNAKRQSSRDRGQHRHEPFGPHQTLPSLSA